jgi:hypothetical protein
MSLAIAEGKAEKFEVIGYGATSADDVLSMAAMLPAADLPQLVEAWTQATIEKARRISLSYDKSKTLQWRISKQKEIRQPIISSHEALGFDVAGSSSRRTARA